MNNEATGELIQLLLKYYNSLEPRKSNESFEEASRRVFPSTLGREAYINTIKAAIQNGADVNYVSVFEASHERVPLLGGAIMTRNIEIVKMMLDAGASWDAIMRKDGIEAPVRKFPFEEYGYPGINPPSSFFSDLAQLGWKGKKSRLRKILEYHLGI